MSLIINTLHFVLWIYRHNWVQIWWQTLILSMIFLNGLLWQLTKNISPYKRVKVNKYKHKLSPWITAGLIKSTEFRDKLYKRLKACLQDNPEHNRMETNLKTYNGYLKQCIRFAKREHYVHEFTKYRNDIRKTWDTLKNIINTKKSKSDFPPYFVEHGDKISGSKTIADKFNEYFTKIGPELASSIDTSH